MLPLLCMKDGNTPTQLIVCGLSAGHAQYVEWKMRDLSVVITTTVRTAGQGWIRRGFHMTELERKALLGDKESQEKCTQQGIILKCPCCGMSVAKIDTVANVEYIDRDNINFEIMSKQFVVVCDYLAGGCGLCVGGSHYNKESALRAWNNRTTPPIGRCKECKHFKNYECTNDYISTDNEGGASYSLNFYVNDYCSYFEMNCQNS